jgi:hypothetical protein
MPEYVPDHVHLVGSIGLNGVEEVFGTVGPMLGRLCVPKTSSGDDFGFDR